MNLVIDPLAGKPLILLVAVSRLPKEIEGAEINRSIPTVFGDSAKRLLKR